MSSHGQPLDMLLVFFLFMVTKGADAHAIPYDFFLHKVCHKCLESPQFGGVRSFVIMKKPTSAKHKKVALSKGFEGGPYVAFHKTYYKTSYTKWKLENTGELSIMGGIKCGFASNKKTNIGILVALRKFHIHALGYCLITNVFGAVISANKNVHKLGKYKSLLYNSTGCICLRSLSISMLSNVSYTGFILAQKQARGSNIYAICAMPDGIVTVMMGLRQAQGFQVYDEASMLLKPSQDNKDNFFFLSEGKVLASIAPKYEDMCIAAFVSELFQSMSYTPDEWQYLASLARFIYGYGELLEGDIPQVHNITPGVNVSKKPHAKASDVYSNKLRVTVFAFVFLELAGYQIDWQKGQEQGQVYFGHKTLKVPPNLCRFMLSWQESDYHPDIIQELEANKQKALYDIGLLGLRLVYPQVFQKVDMQGI